jgi:hypothetical protein
MALNDALQKHKEPKRPGYRCGLCRYLESPDTSEEDFKALTNALNDSAFQSTGISRALNEEGIQISHTTVQRHRAAKHVIERQFEETSTRKPRRSTQKGKSS